MFCACMCVWYVLCLRVCVCDLKVSLPGSVSHVSLSFCHRDITVMVNWA